MTTKAPMIKGSISPRQALKKRPMEPREFCRRWFKATSADEEERGYRNKCVKLMADVLRVQENTIQRWGKGLDFPEMPQTYKVTLAYADILREMIESTHQHTDLLKLVLSRLPDISEK